MKISLLTVKRDESFHIDIFQPQCDLYLQDGEDYLDGVDLLFDDERIKLKGYYPHMGYLWFIFEAFKPGSTTITLLCSKLGINHNVIVRVE